MIPQILSFDAKCPDDVAETLLSIVADHPWMPRFAACNTDEEVRAETDLLGQSMGGRPDPWPTWQYAVRCEGSRSGFTERARILVLGTMARLASTERQRQLWESSRWARSALLDVA